MKIECKNLKDTQKLAYAFAKNLPKSGCFVSLYGDIGAGKTAFVRYVLKELGVKEKITSPSFVILNEYLGYLMPIYHFDLYRLEKEGLKTIMEEVTDYSHRNVLTFVEWANFGEEALSYDRLNIKISYPDNLDYCDEGELRYFEFSAQGMDNSVFLDNIIKDYEAAK